MIFITKISLKFHASQLCYIPSTWYQKHLSKCPQPSGAIVGWTWTRTSLHLNHSVWI